MSPQRSVLVWVRCHGILIKIQTRSQRFIRHNDAAPCTPEASCISSTYLLYIWEIIRAVMLSECHWLLPCAILGYGLHYGVAKTELIGLPCLFLKPSVAVSPLHHILILCCQLVHSACAVEL